MISLFEFTCNDCGHVHNASKKPESCRECTGDDISETCPACGEKIDTDTRVCPECKEAL